MPVLHTPHDLLPRDLYSSPPPPQDAITNNPSLLLSWWCTCFSFVIILVRLAGRWVRTERLFLEDKIMAASVIPLFARMACVHLVLRLGTNNAITDGLSADDIWNREIGSRSVLPARILYAAFLWIAKLTIAEFLRRNFAQMWQKSWSLTLNIIRWFLAVTFCGVLVATLTECQPFSHYWQVVLDPGPHCRQGLVQLITMGVADTITDLTLVAFPVHVIFASKMRLQRKISLSLLFALSLILIAITIYRMYAVVSSNSNQQIRSLIASLEILAATAVSNALILGSFVRDRGVKKAKFKFGSVGGDSALDRPTSARTRKHTRAALSWGSDVDLVSDVGIRLPPEFRQQKTKVARPAPAALPHLETNRPIFREPFGDRPSVKTDEADLDKSPKYTTHQDDEIRPTVLTPRRMSFFDVGGLLGEAPPPRRPSEASVQLPPDFALSPQIRSPVERRKSPRSRRFFNDMGSILDIERDRSRGPSHNPSRSHSRNPSRNHSRNPSRNPSVSSTGSPKSPRTLN